MTDELVALGFATTPNLTQSPLKAGCRLVRLSCGSAGGHKRTDLLFPHMVDPGTYTLRKGRDSLQTGVQGLCIAAQGGYVAFTGYQGEQHGVVLVFPDNTHQFLPLEEPTGRYLCCIDFAGDTRTLALSYIKRDPGDWDEQRGFDYDPQTRFVRWESRRLAVADNTAGWLARVRSSQALLADRFGRAATYDFASHRPLPDAPLEARLAALLAERRSPRVRLPRYYPIDGRSVARPGTYAVSPNVAFMFEEALHEYPPANKPYQGAIEDIVTDGIWAAGRGLLWTITHRKRAGISSFEFTSDWGDFRFLCPGPLWMGRQLNGRDHHRSYPPGLFEVELSSGRVRHRSLASLNNGPITAVVVQAQQLGLLRPPTNGAGEVVGSAARADAFLRFTPLFDMLLMKRGVA